MARLVFFGTPEFAVPSLEALLEAQAQGHELVAVVCQQDRPRGRGKRVQAPPVKERAQEAGIEILQPPTLKKGTESGDAFFEHFSSLEVDLAVVAAYGRILPRRILELPTRGFVNIHASLLPRWRGAAPIQRAIQAGDPKTGVCLMDMIFALDAGDVYAQESVSIRPEDDGASLTRKLATLGKELLQKHLGELLEGTLTKTPQASEGVSYAPMLRKEEAWLDWHRPARELWNQVRAMAPWPGSQTKWRGEVLKLFAPSLPEANPVQSAGLSAGPGEVVKTDASLQIATGEGVLSFKEVQFPGKRRMPVSDALRGRALKIGDQLTT